MKTGWKTLMVAGIAVLGLSSLVMAGAGGGPGFGRGPMHGAGPGMMAHGPGPMGLGPGGALGFGAAQLNLTDEQRQVIRTICQQSRADANEVVAAIDDARAALHEAVIAGADEAKIRTAATALGTAIGNQAVLQSQTITAVKAVLTEEQRKEYEKICASVPHSPRPMGGQGFGGGRWGLQPHGANGFDAQGQPPVHSVAPNGPAPVPHLGIEQMFKSADTNKDGTLSMEELKAFHDTATRRPGTAASAVGCSDVFKIGPAWILIQAGPVCVPGGGKGSARGNSLSAR